jgi:AmpE protein
MTILSLLISLVLERVAFKRPSLEASYYAHGYFFQLTQKQWLNGDKSAAYWLFIAFIPTVIVALVMGWIPGALLSFIAQTAVLFICVGSQRLRDTYKCFLKAANRGDVEACYLYSEQMGHCDTQPDKCPSFGLQLIWLNYQYYGGIVIAFVLFGVSGAVFYTLVREAFEFCCQQEDFSVNAARKLRFWVDWLPVRIWAFGMLIVGNFASGLPVWMASLFDFSSSASSVLTRVSSSAEVLPANENGEADVASEPTMLVRLAKRNMMFILVVVSLFTVFGVL